ncbi:MAG: hypothetical protein C4523_16280 [Myxococcales bacterium]|nr:MAG: hypothetical protein C4523_16280 [Myxococcales bacterium]
MSRQAKPESQSEWAAQGGRQALEAAWHHQPSRQSKSPRQAKDAQAGSPPSPTRQRLSGGQSASREQWRHTPDLQTSGSGHSSDEAQPIEAESTQRYVSPSQT